MGRSFVGHLAGLQGLKCAARSEGKGQSLQFLMGCVIDVQGLHLCFSMLRTLGIVVARGWLCWLLQIDLRQMFGSRAQGANKPTIHTL